MSFSAHKVNVDVKKAENVSLNSRIKLSACVSLLNPEQRSVKSLQAH